MGLRKGTAGAAAGGIEGRVAGQAATSPAEVKQQQQASADTANLVAAAQQHADHLQSSLK